MRFISIAFLIMFFSFYIVKAQTIFPYLEVNKNVDVKKISADSVEIKSNYNHFLNDVTYHFYYTNTSDENIDLRFVVPQHYSQNIYQLAATYQHETIYLKAKSISTIRQEIHSLKSKSGYENQEITQNSILEIANLKAGEKLVVTLKFAKIIEPNGITYSVKIPEQIVVRSAEFTANGINTLNSKPKLSISEFNFTGNLPLDYIKINQQIPNINKVSASKWIIKSLSTQQLIIEYQYDSKSISSTIQHFSDANCDYILGTIHPPKEIKEIAPREFIFIIDASGSMKGRPIEEVKKMMLSVLKQLNDNELFNIILYATNSNHFATKSVLATTENIENAINYLENEYGKGGTKLNDAVEFVEKFSPNPKYNRIITILTDGDLDINENLHLTIKNQAKNAQFFILGIGNSIDYRAMNFLSLSTGSQPIIITNEYEMRSKINQFQKKILKPILRNVQVQSKNINLTETFPKNFNGFLSIEPIHFVTKDCRKIYPKNLEITAKNGDFDYSKKFEIKSSNPNDFTEVIKFYWLKQKIDFLLKDEDRCGELCKKDGRYRKEIEKLGSENNLSTPYTVLIQSNNNANFSQDYDSDSDGIPDWFDECINEQGTLLTKGCPIHKISDGNKPIYVQDYSNQMIRSIEFDLDKSIIRPVDYPTLEKVVKIMIENPTLKFYIEGHTDARGTKEYNNTLSTTRAEAVLQYLTQKGVDKNRFTIIGKGANYLKYKECFPADVCEEWKNLANRRVEFILKKD